MAALNHLRKPLAIILALLILVPLSPASIRGSSQTGPEAFGNYLVRLAQPETVVPASDAARLIAHDQDRRRAELARVLDRMVSAGTASGYTFDETSGAFRTSLTEAGRIALLSSPLVASVEPDTAAAPDALVASSDGVRIQSVSSVAFLQVYTPFVWGRVSANGLSVQLTLEDASGSTIAVPTQGTAADSIKIDRTQLYYETTFVDPTTHALVNMQPGQRVRVFTSGVDPVTGLPATDERRITVDDVRAWTSTNEDVVSGIAPPNASLVVTVGTMAVSKYLTPGTSMTYAELTAAADGTFSVSGFRTTADTSSKRVSLAQGITGFVRVRHPDGNEVYTVHGQSVFVLQNSSSFHAYAQPLPTSPSSLDNGVATSHPKQSVTATLKDPQGQTKATDQPGAFGALYSGGFLYATILAGDTLEVATAFNQAGPVTVPVTPMAGAIDLAGSQITGTGPANKKIYLGAGRISGYMTDSTNADFLVKEVTSSGTGAFSSGQIACGQSNTLVMRPGSFGYAGFENSRYDFVYLSVAAPIHQVMSDFPFIEGWMANGTDTASITVQRADGGLREQLVASPGALWVVNQKLFIYNYYAWNTAQYILPGDVVTVVSAGQTSVIPVDRITAYLNTDTEGIQGEAPAGSTVRMVPGGSLRSMRREVVAGQDGTYNAGNPFTNFTNSSCSESPRSNVTFDPGDSGRAFIRHSDGNEVFTYFGRSMHVLQNDNTLDVYTFPHRDLDAFGRPPARKVTLTLTPKVGSPFVMDANAPLTQAGKVSFTLVTATGQKVLIRVGDSITVSFDEGPATNTRNVTLSMSNMAMVTATPDTDTNTLAGVGPRGWSGHAELNPPPTALPAAIAPSALTAYAPVRFTNSSGATVGLVRGYSGQVSFTSSQGYRIWTAWAVTAYAVKITGWLRPGDLQVCGKAPAGSTVRIHDVTTEGQDLVIGTGTADSQGNYCVSVAPPLYENEVLMAEVDGSWSQPVVVRHVYLIMAPNLTKE